MNSDFIRAQEIEQADAPSFLYQSGYLTITEYDAARKRYTLGFPNNEVRYAFLESLMPEYVPSATAGNRLDIFTVDEYIENGETEKISVPYAGNGFEEQIIHFCNCVSAGLKQSPVVTPEQTLYITRQMDKIRKMTGITYPQDK